MAEALTAAVMLGILRDLHAVFPGRLTDDDLSRKVGAYHEALRGHDADDVRWASAQCVREDDYFPKPNRLIELAAKRRASTRATVAPLNDGRWCPACRRPFEQVARYRVRVELKPGGPVVQLTACGEFVVLDLFTRELCAVCTPACQVPHPDHETPVMPVSQLSGYEATCKRERSGVAL